MKYLGILTLALLLFFVSRSCAHYQSASDDLPKIIMSSESPEKTYKVYIYEKVSAGESPMVKYGNHEAFLEVKSDKEEPLLSYKLDEGDGWDSLVQNEYKRIQWLKESVFMIDGMNQPNFNDQIRIRNNSNETVKNLIIHTSVLQKFVVMKLKSNENLELNLFPHQDYVWLYIEFNKSGKKIIKNCSFTKPMDNSNQNNSKIYDVNVLTDKVEVTSLNYNHIKCIE